KRAILRPSWTDPDPQEDGFPLDQTFSQFKTDQTPWLSEVPAQVIRNGVVLYKRAWSNHWQNPSHFRRPRAKRKWDRNSVWLTRELFRFVGPGRVEIGTAANPIGVLSFVEHWSLPEPASITLTRTRYEHWFLSYATDALEGPEMAPDETRLVQLAKDPDLPSKVLGIDRGIALLAARSDGGEHRMEEHLEARIAKLERRRRRYQRQASRRQKGSRRRDKALGKAARQSARIASIRNDFLRKEAFRIAEVAPEVVALEDLNLKGMTRRPKPKRDEATGKWVRNGAAQKSCLNKALAHAGLGNLAFYLRQALAKRGKLLVLVPAHHSSQECSECGFVHEGNRTSQGTFLCLRCGHAENADHNAAKVIKKRGIALISTAGTAGSARRGPAGTGRPKGRGGVRRDKGGQPPPASPAKRETPSSTERLCVA
ncbi:MAG TPA: transposase, partial [Holophaga sp.]|nr:transposase [Holophaga sp.]